MAKKEPMTLASTLSPLFSKKKKKEEKDDRSAPLEKIGKPFVTNHTNFTEDNRVVPDSFGEPWNGLCRVVPSRMIGPRPPSKYRVLSEVCPLLRQSVHLCLDGIAPWPLFIWGEPGSGKTCCGLLIYDCYGGLHTTLEDFIDRVRTARSSDARHWNFGQGKKSEELEWEAMKTCPLAVIDEVGERETSDFRTATFKKLLDAREQLPTLYISNVSLDGIAGMYDSRIRSRLGAGTKVQTVGGDRRARKEPPPPDDTPF